MGFFSSLKGQIGRDTGRVVSNFVYGDKHATKYKRVDNDNAKNVLTNLKIQRDYEFEILEQEKKKEEFKTIQEKKAFINQNLKRIISMKVPDNKELLVDQLYSLSVEITSNPWKYTEGDIDKILNVYTDAVFKKYEQHLFALKTKFPDTTEIIYFEKQYNQYKKQAFVQKHKLFLIGILLAVICGIGIFFEKSNKQEKPIKDFFKSLTEKIK